MLGTDAFQQHTGRFVVRVLRHQFTAKGFGEGGRGEFFDLGAGGLMAVGKGEQGFDEPALLSLQESRGQV